MAREVHDFVKKSLVATHMKNAKAVETSVALTVGSIDFVATGRRVDVEGYLRVADWERWDSIQIGDFSAGSKILVNLEPTKVCVAAPQLHTQASLTELALRHGLATSGTCSELIRDLLKKNLVKEEGNHLVPTAAGSYLCYAYRKINAGAVLGVELKQAIMDEVAK